MEEARREGGFYIYTVGASTEVLTVYESCIQSESLVLPC